MTRINMTTQDWHELMKPVLPHAINDKDFPELDVVRLEVGDRALYAVATDRYSLAAERWEPETGPLYGDTGQVVHLDAREATASLKLFTYTKDENPPLTVIIDTARIPVSAAGQQVSVNRLAVTVQQAGEGTRLMLHDVRNPAKDPLAGWRKGIRTALSRPPGGKLEGLDLHAGMLSRWAAAARRGERLTMYTGTEPGDTLLIIVEQHFAGLWAVPPYLDGPGKVLADLPWHAELRHADAGAADGEPAANPGDSRAPDERGGLLRLVGTGPGEDGD
jgi:hypothetical protein